MIVKFRPKALETNSSSAHSLIINRHCKYRDDFQSYVNDSFLHIDCDGTMGFPAKFSDIVLALPSVMAGKVIRAFCEKHHLDGVYLKNNNHTVLKCSKNNHWEMDIYGDIKPHYSSYYDSLKRRYPIEMQDEVGHWVSILENPEVYVCYYYDDDPNYFDELLENLDVEPTLAFWRNAMMEKFGISQEKWEDLMDNWFGSESNDTERLKSLLNHIHKYERSYYMNWDKYWDFPVNDLDLMDFLDIMVEEIYQSDTNPFMIKDVVRLE